MKKLLLFILVAVILIAGCVEEKEPITRLVIDGMEYVFSEDVMETLEIPIYSSPNITKTMDSPHIYIAFNSTNSTENSYFTVVAYNIVFRITRQKTWELKTVNFTIIPIENITNVPTLMFIGPSQSNETSVIGLDNLTIIQGTDFRNLTMAADRLSLLLLGVISKTQIEA